MVKKYKKQVEMDWRGSNGSKWANPPMMGEFLLWNKVRKRVERETREIFC